MKEPDLFRMQIVANRCKESLVENKIESLLVFAFDTLECKTCPAQRQCKSKDKTCCVDELSKYIYRK